MAAGGAGCRYPGGCALGDNGSLELGDRTKYMEDQPAAGSGGVDGFDERAQLDAAALQVAGDGEQVGERTAEAVKPPHHEHATAAGVVEQRGQLGAVVASPGHAFGPNPFGSGVRQRLCPHALVPSLAGSRAPVIAWTG